MILLLPSMRFYVISIVSIFAALGIGIYIGLAMDAQNLIIEQKEDLATKLEQKFEDLRSENQSLKVNVAELKDENDIKDIFIKSTYEEIIKNKLEDLNIAIIETNPDYVYSSIGKELEDAGAKVVNVTTLNKNITDTAKLNDIFASLEENVNGDPVTKAINSITESIVKGEEYPLVEKLKEEGLIYAVGEYNEPIDYVIICGGSLDSNLNRINKVDKIIVNTVKALDIPVIGVEKSTVNYSYIESYKAFRISTVDNTDMIIGKVAVILAMDNRPGHYGIKPSSEKVVPNLENLAVE